ncbi:hypothetical protein HDV06_005339, partial [Boothiomyces sp. JEL0866]
MERIFERFDLYDFENDDRFQKGKAALSGNILQIKHFYYSKFQEKFDLNAYLEWKNKSSLKNTESTEDKEKEAPKLTFQEIMEKIQKGEEIPGIKQIPDTVHET